MNVSTNTSQPSNAPEHYVIHTELHGPMGCILAFAVLEQLAPNLFWVWPFGVFDQSGKNPLDLRTLAERQTINNPVVDREDACAALADWAVQVCAPICQA